MNEELQTINRELAHRVQELAKSNSDIKNLLQSTQIATIFLDDELRINSFTPTVAEIFHLEDSDIGRPVTQLARALNHDGLAADAQHVLRTLATVEREVDDNRTNARYLLRILPYRSIDNIVAGVVLTFVDITRVSQVERALIESEERFRMMTEVVPDIMFTILPDGTCDYINSRFYEYTGLSEGVLVGEFWGRAIHPEDYDEQARRWQRSIETGEPLDVTARLRGADSAYRWHRVRAEPMRDASGQVVRWFGSASDVHEYRMASDRQRMLVGELQHRVKNILAVVRSIFIRSMESDGESSSCADHFRGRLDALGRTQNVLARTPEGGIDLEEMIHDELTSLGAQNGDQIHVSGPPISLRQKAAEVLGLAIHELATNATKYGALAIGSGHIEVTWRLYDSDTGPRLAWKWVESGVRLIDPAPSRIGFGRELIEQGLPYQLGAITTLEFANGGVSCAIDLPLSDRLTMPGEERASWEISS